MMDKKTFDRTRRYESAADFFLLGGSVGMRLSRLAALSVCKEAAANSLFVSRIEGGIWHDPKFEARTDCIWSGTRPPVSEMAAKRNNENAYKFIADASGIHDAFIVTVLPIEDL